LILDTSALSVAADGHPGVLTILAGVQQVALPVVVIGEYRYGIAQSRHKASYRRWLDALIAECSVLDITEQTADHYAAIRLELRDAESQSQPMISGLRRSVGNISSRS